MNYERESDCDINIMQEQLLAELKKHAGELVVQTVMQSEEIAYEHLRSPKAKYRYAALALYGLSWPLTQAVADLCEEQAITDTDTHVRGLSTSQLAAFYYSTGNMRVGNLLSSIVSNEEEDARVREVAYRALFRIPKRLPSNRPRASGFNFPADVDWGYVNSFRKRTLFPSFLFNWLTWFT